MIRRALLVLCCMAFVVVSAQGQKELRSIRQNIKASKDLDGATKQVDELSKKAEFKLNPELYVLGGMAQMKINDVENEKIYLKQKYDTVRFFSSIYRSYDYLIRCDSVEQIPNARGKVKFRFRNKNRDVLKRLRTNLLNGGRYYLKKNNYAEADKFFTMYLEAPGKPLFTSDPAPQKADPFRPRVAAWDLLCRYSIGHYDKALEYREEAATDTALRRTTLEYEAKTALALKDTALIELFLGQGVREYPTYPFFFTSAMDYFNGSKQYDNAILLVDTLMKVCGENKLMLYAKSLTLLNMSRYDDCISLSLELLKVDSLFADAYYNIGLCYCNKAAGVDSQLNPNINSANYQRQKRRVRSYYEKARPFLETYRKMQPSLQDKWAPLLYRVYLSLNQGKQFDEIDALMKKK